MVLSLFQKILNWSSWQRNRNRILRRDERLRQELQRQKDEERRKDEERQRREQEERDRKDVEKRKINDNGLKPRKRRLGRRGRKKEKNNRISAPAQKDRNSLTNNQHNLQIIGNRDYDSSDSDAWFGGNEDNSDNEAYPADYREIYHIIPGVLKIDDRYTYDYYFNYDRYEDTLSTFLKRCFWAFLISKLPSGYVVNQLALEGWVDANSTMNFTIPWNENEFEFNSYYFWLMLVLLIISTFLFKSLYTDFLGQYRNKLLYLLDMNEYSMHSFRFRRADIQQVLDIHYGETISKFIEKEMPWAMTEVRISGGLAVVKFLTIDDGQYYWEKKLDLVQFINRNVDFVQEQFHECMMFPQYYYPSENVRRGENILSHSEFFLNE